MKYLIIHVLCWSLCSTASAQNIREFTEKNVVRISNIDTLSDDYSDLEPIGNAIGNARIVMLGEQDHGDAPSLLAKTRLIKYLHEKKGFNVLAFESDFYGLTVGWEKLPRQPDSIYKFLKVNVYPLWTRTDACNYLFSQYIPGTFRTSQPLNISGFDPQLSLSYSRAQLKNDLNDNLQTKFSGDSSYQTFLVALEELITRGRTSDAHKKALQAGLDIIQQSGPDNNDTSYWNVLIDNLVTYNNNSNENRDKRMSANLKFLANAKYRNEKIIVWAANSHIMKYTDQIKSNKKNFDQVIFRNMGTDFTKDPLFRADTYVLGFASYGGSAGRLWSKTYQIEAPAKNGLENWIPDGITYGFLDLKKYNQLFNSPNEPFLMKAPWHFTIPDKVARIPWNLAYDGIFFIRDMYPVKKLD